MIGKMWNAHKITVKKPERYQSQNQDADGEDNININLKEKGCGLDESGSGYGPVAGSCEHGNEPSDSIKGWRYA